MFTEEIFSDELLQQAAAKLVVAINSSLPPPNECQHRFSDGVEKRFNLLSTIWEPSTNR